MSSLDLNNCHRSPTQRPDYKLRNNYINELVDEILSIPTKQYSVSYIYNKFNNFKKTEDVSNCKKFLIEIKNEYRRSTIRLAEGKNPTTNT